MAGTTVGVRWSRRCGQRDGALQPRSLGAWVRMRLRCIQGLTSRFAGAGDYSLHGRGRGPRQICEMRPGGDGALHRPAVRATRELCWLLREPERAEQPKRVSACLRGCVPACLRACVPVSQRPPARKTKTRQASESRSPAIGVAARDPAWMLHPLPLLMHPVILYRQQFGQKSKVPERAGLVLTDSRRQLSRSLLPGLAAQIWRHLGDEH
jgi:hypothetical protein